MLSPVQITPVNQPQNVKPVLQIVSKIAHQIVGLHLKINGSLLAGKVRMCALQVGDILGGTKNLHKVLLEDIAQNASPTMTENLFDASEGISMRR